MKVVTMFVFFNIGSSSVVCAARSTSTQTWTRNRSPQSDMSWRFWQMDQKPSSSCSSASLPSMSPSGCGTRVSSSSRSSSSLCTESLVRLCLWLQTGHLLSSAVSKQTVSVYLASTGVLFLTWILNKFRLVPLEFIDQVIMSYGGLRGAVAYGLATMLDDSRIKEKEKKLMVCTTLIVVYFTVVLQVNALLSRSWLQSQVTRLLFSCFLTLNKETLCSNLFVLQGITMKPLVTWLKVKRAAVSEPTLIEKVQNKVNLKTEQVEEP